MALLTSADIETVARLTKTDVHLSRAQRLAYLELIAHIREQERINADLHRALTLCEETIPSQDKALAEARELLTQYVTQHRSDAITAWCPCIACERTAAWLRTDTPSTQ